MNKNSVAQADSKSKCSFAALIAEYNATQSADTLMQLATACTYSVLKKVIDPQRRDATKKATVSDSGHNPALVSLKREVTADSRALVNLTEAANKATRATLDADGNPVTVTADKDALAAVNALIIERLGDGLDLVQDAALAILAEAQKQAEREPGQPLDLERTYTERRLNRKVWIKAEEAAGAWQTVETTPIQEVFKAIRRCVQASRAVQTDPRNGYLYLDDITRDDESGAEERIYRRMQKYADLGSDGRTERVANIYGAPADLYGRGTTYTADAQTVADTDTLLARLNLSAQQALILKYRLAGYGYKAIATALCVREDNVKRQVKRIRDKAQEIGLHAPEK